MIHPVSGRAGPMALLVLALVPAGCAATLGCPPGSTEQRTWLTRGGHRVFCEEARTGRTTLGPWARYNDAGVRVEEGYFFDNQQHGMWRQWRDDGTPLLIEQYRAGRLVHEVRFHPNGKPASEKRYAVVYGKTLPHGEWLRWHEGGRLAEQGSYRYGVKTGRWTTLDARGRVIESADLTPERDRPCAERLACTQSGRCQPYRGVCVGMSEAQCRASPECKSDGRCTPYERGCVATREEDCRQSSGCLEHARCRAGALYCEVSDASCRAHPGCAVEGTCAAHHGRCVANTDVQCRASAACRDEGRCQVVEGRCTKGCRALSACADAGLCERTPDQRCVAANDADCGRSQVCRESGSCSVVEGECAVRTDADCRRSLVCTKNGKCLARKGYCASRQDLKCSCPPPGIYSEEGVRAHEACLKGGGGWGPSCGPPPP